jgi:large subunit ribosomal protein L20
MSRVKRGVIALKRRRNVLADAKGYRFHRSQTERAAKVAITKAGVHAFNHRKDKKADMRRLWTIRMNAALRPLGLSYSKFINMLKVKNITLDRKVLAEIAMNNIAAFERIVGVAK